ncbi:MAG: protein-L-isoaspartate O-methyltransferase [Methanotrichaceae archaeon]
MRINDLLDELKGQIDERVINAMAKIPRDIFVPQQLRSSAYDDVPLPIGYGQTISAPHMVAIMCEFLDLKEGLKVLDIGGGSGYHAAVMAELVGPHGHVYSVERIPELAEQAKKNLQAAGIANVTVVLGDGSKGLEEYAPYDRINVAATAPRVPELLKKQLKPGGRMVIPVGSGFQSLLLVTRKNGYVTEEKLPVAFVPLIGEEGFKEYF